MDARLQADSPNPVGCGNREADTLGQLEGDESITAGLPAMHAPLLDINPPEGVFVPDRPLAEGASAIH